MICFNSFFWYYDNDDDVGAVYQKQRTLTGCTRLLTRTKRMVLSMSEVMQGVAEIAFTNWRQNGKMVVRKSAEMKIWTENTV